MSQFVPDPRAATATAVGGPPDLVGQELVIVDRVNIGGRTVDLPRPLPGVVEYAAVVRAETLAEELRPRLLQDLDERGPVPFQPNTPLVINMQGAAATAITSAVAGLEAFANHHITRMVTPSSPAPIGALDELRNAPINERFADVLPALLECQRPTSEPWWPTLRRIQRLAVLQRHALTDPASGARGLPGGESPLVERVANGEYVGAGNMMLSAFEHFCPGWIGGEKLAALSDPTFQL